MASWSFWIDRGGTFTDTVALSPSGQLLSSKFLSVNPKKYDDAAIHSIRNFLSIPNYEKIPVSKIESIKMGTTVATNALLERRGARTVGRSRARSPTRPLPSTWAGTAPIPGRERPVGLTAHQP